MGDLYRALPGLDWRASGLAGADEPERCQSFIRHSEKSREPTSERPRRSSAISGWPKNKGRLARQGIRGVHLPDKFSSIGIGDFLRAQGLTGKRVLLARSSSADNSLGRELAKNGAIVETVNLYDSVIPSDATSFQRFVDLVQRGDIQAILFTSSLSASNLFLMSKNYVSVDELVPRLRKIRIGAIGPVTARRLAELGVPPTIIPETFIIDDALKELLS